MDPVDEDRASIHTMGDNYDDEDDPTIATSNKAGNVLPVWGNEKSMNLNSLILTNIQGSPYFKVQLFGLKTYHEVIDEIYYRVTHIEPWEAGSRKTGGQTGMCGGVRGVGAGGIVSSAFCLLYKLFTLKLTRKQLIGMLNHADSPYIRALGFMYARYTLPPADLWGWFVDYLCDEEEIDVKAGGGCVVYMGDMARDFLVKLDWYGALFPRIPVPIQKLIVANLKEYGPTIKDQYVEEQQKEEEARLAKEQEEREMKQKAERDSRRGREANSHKDSRDRHRDRERDRGHRHRDRSADRHRDSRGRRDGDDYSRELRKFEKRQERDRRRSRSRDRHKRSRSRERSRRSRSKDKSSKRSRSHDRGGR